MNTSILMIAGIALAGVLAGGGLVFGIYRAWSRRRMDSAERIARQVVESAKKEAAAREKEAALKAKELLFQSRSQFEKESRDKRQELKKLEGRIAQKEENLERKVDFLERRDNELKNRESKFEERERGLQAKEKEAEELLENQRQQLQRIAGLTQEEAKRSLLDSLREEAEKEAVQLRRQIETDARDQAEKEAHRIISLAIQRYAADQVSEITVSTVSLPGDEMKGRIIGREGRNIRSFQAATGVDVIVDDTPEVVVLSAFDPVRREVARIALERLISDGRIHPPRIEEIVKKVQEEVELAMKEMGERTAFDVGIHGLKPELIKLLGRLKYRTSYGQNVLDHSREVAYIMGIMAAEIGEDIQTAKKVGLLHDIGKAVDHEIEGPHASIGAALARKFGLPEMVINGIASHHGETEASSVFDVLGQAADAMSAARPGARRESFDAYIKRLERLEQFALSFPGVKKAYAIQAGREIRVMVEPESVDDNGTIQIARGISKKIEAEMDYPGQVKVTAVRESRAVDYAR